MTDDFTGIAKGRQPLVKNHNEHLIRIIPNPKTSTERFRKVNFDTNPSKLGS